jgi:hypothetical protein
MRARPSDPTVMFIGLGALAVMAVACGSESSGKKHDGGGAVGAGGVTASGGVSGTGGLIGSGGGSGTGTGVADASDVTQLLDAGADAPAADAPAVDAPAVDASALDATLDKPMPDAPALDTGLDASGQTCGDAACGPGQACVLKAGGPVPQCLAPTAAELDAGACSDGWVLVPSCSVGGGPTHYQPGCTTPPPSPRCYDVPGACEDICSCVCGLPLDRGCNPGPGYYLCSYP